MPTISPSYPSHARKRAVDLTLNEGLVAQARHYSTTLSATMEESLEPYVAEQRDAYAGRRKQADACAQDWNAVHDKIGSFADEHSTL